MSDRLLTVRHVADLLGIQPNTLHQWRRSGVGPKSIKIGRCLRYREADVDAYLASRVAAEADRYSPGAGEGA